MKNLVKHYVPLGFMAAVLMLASCKKEEPSLGNAPSSADAQFTYKASAQSDNIIEFTATNSGLSAKWDFGNGSKAEGTTVTGTYPNAGTYTVTLTVFNSGGSASSSQDIVIAQDDPSLLNNPLYDLLTGGTSGPGYKVWAVDSAAAGHFGVGPNPSQNGDWPEWYSAGALEKAGSGMYNDRYTFHLQGFKFDMETGGDVYVNTESAVDWPNAVQSPVGDYIAQFANQMDETWNLVEGSDTTISISGDAFIGYYTDVQTYRIISIGEEELFLRFEDSRNTDLAWYLRLVPEGVVTGTPVVKYSLPFDFETVEPTWTTFGNSTTAVVANPDASGINTSAKVLETVHGNETWAGFYVNLDNALDFSTNSEIALKVWAPDTGTFRFKLEEQKNTSNFVELDAKVTVAQTWQEISVDFSGAAAQYDRLVLFPGWDVANAGTYYIDDIVQK
ncbi:MAG: carbohydrate-binding protein [Owenweeksia sp.]|nr:carbohydrate-binding protein [Owenweeksia sp.]|tara:strand:+ start:5477 stop:6811 length:1335 start_codon:yes stop_codon:yes gene_type:complete